MSTRSRQLKRPTSSPIRTGTAGGKSPNEISSDHFRGEFQTTIWSISYTRFLSIIKQWEILFLGKLSLNNPILSSRKSIFADNGFHLILNLNQRE